MSRTLDEVIDDLSYGALSNLAIGNSGTGSIPPAQQAKITHHINRGLTKLHARFVIYQRELFIRIQEGVTLYPLITEAGEAYVDLDPANPSMKYIIDNVAAPFPADVIRVLECWKADPNTPDEIIEVPVNDSEAEESVHTPASDVIQILDGEAGDVYQFMYQADHYKLAPGLGSQIVYLPEYLYEPLEHYVAGKIFAAMNGEEHRARAADHMAAYQMAIQIAVDLDLVREVPVVTNTKLEMRGFK